MGKQALFAVAGFLGLCGLVSGQEIRDFGSIQPAKAQADYFGTLTNAWNGPVPLQLADGRAFSFPNAFAWLEAPPAYYIPAMPLAAPPRLFPITPFVPDSRGPAVNFLPGVDYAYGEVSFLYGRYTGKSGGDVYAGNIFGEVVEGNTHISASASYQRVTGRVPAPVFIPGR